MASLLNIYFAELASLCVVLQVMTPSLSSMNAQANASWLRRALWPWETVHPQWPRRGSGAQNNGSSTQNYLPAWDWTFSPKHCLSPAVPMMPFCNGVATRDLLSPPFRWGWPSWPTRLWRPNGTRLIPGGGQALRRTSVNSHTNVRNCQHVHVRIIAPHKNELKLIQKTKNPIQWYVDIV